MAGQDKRINDLNPLSGADVANNDVMPIVDQSAFETKKITFQDLKSRITEGSAPLSSPTFTGEPKAPTVTPSNDSSEKIATTAFVQNALSGATVPDATTTTKGKIMLSGDLGGTADSPTVPELANKAPINSPSLIGSPTAPTPANGDNSTKIATTAYVQDALSGASIPDATTTVKGKIKLAGDLGGTADTPTVPELANKVTGPAVSTNNSIPRFNGATGKLLKNSGVLIDDSDNLSGVKNLVADGRVNALGYNHQEVLISTPVTFLNPVNAGSVFVLTNSFTTTINYATNASPAGQQFTIINRTGGTLVVTHQSPASSSENRFTLPGMKDMSLINGEGATFVYSNSQMTWQLMHKSSLTNSGNPSSLAMLTADDSLSDWESTATFQISKINPIQGDASYRLSMTIDEATILKLKSVDPVFRGRTLALKFNYRLSSGVIRVILYKQGNVKIDGGEFIIPPVNGIGTFATTFFMPADATGFRFGAVAESTEAGEDFQFDNVEISSDLLKSVNIADRWQQLRASTVSGITFNLATGTKEGDSSLFSVSGNVVTALRDIELSGSATVGGTSTAASGYVNVSALLGANSLAQDLSSGVNGTGVVSSIGFKVKLFANQSVTLNSSTASTSGTNHSYVIFATARTESIVAPVDQVTERSIAFRWRSPAQATEANLSATGLVGDYVTGQYSAGNNISQCASRPDQPDSEMSVNGIRIFTRVADVASSAGSPARFVIKIAEPGQMSSCSYRGYADGTKLIQLVLESVKNTTTTFSGLWIREFNPATGLLTLDAGLASTGMTAKTLYSTAGVSYTNGYICFTASKLAQAVAIPRPLIAYLKDVKPNGTNGGTNVSGSWATRTLNTIEGDSGIVSLSANRFTLGKGKYAIHASVPANQVNRHKAKLRDITNSLDLIIGTSAYCEGVGGGTSGTDQTESFISGMITLSGETSLEIQHMTQEVSAGGGMGVPSSFGVPEVYTQVKITKLD